MIRLGCAHLRSLRHRLVLGTAVLAIVAVASAETAGLLALRSTLITRVDRQLEELRIPSRVLDDAVAGREPPAPGGGLPTDFRVYLYDEAGRLLDAPLGSDGESAIHLPATLDDLDLTQGEPATMPAASGDGDWRVLLQEGGSAKAHAVVALPLDTVEAATWNLLWFSLALLALATGAVVLLGWAVVRLGLRPLTRMERTAQAIAAGDITLNLPDTDPRTETGRLSQVLNSVLERLREALRRHEESEARLRRFVADAGHELRTPLTSVQGFAELVLQEPRPADTEQREALRLIVQNAERMSQLVDDLVLLARLDREPAYAKEPVDLLSVAIDTIRAAAVQHPQRPVTLEALRGVDGQPDGELDLVETVGDIHRLRQVAGNLLTNALIHTPPGTGISIRVGFTQAGPDTAGTDRPGRSATAPPLARGTRVCVLEVADTGPGLDAEQAERVFERFYRADPARVRQPGGAGLGLAIAAVITDGHNGRLELERPGDSRQ